MSTNYYVATARKCEDCQVEHMRYCGIHLGKSSGGNRFLNVSPTNTAGR